LVDIINSGVHIQGCEVTYDNGTVNLAGECATQADMEKAVLLAGNVAGVNNVFVNGLGVRDNPAASAINNPADPAVAEGAAGSAAPVDAPAGEVEQTEFYVIKSGDTLSKIAKEVYGDAMAYTRIFDANKEVIQDPDKIFVGQKIRIPK